MDRKQYMRQYVAANRSKFQRTPEQQARYNARRRAEYARDPEVRNTAKKQAKAYRDGRPLRRRATMYSLTEDQLEGMLDQGCSICHANPYVDATVKLHVDHDHQTGITRGVLCQPCNLALGHLCDDPIRVMAMFDYIMRPAINGLSGAA